MQETQETQETILAIGSGYRPFREYVLRGLAEQFRIVLVESEPLDWQLRYVADHRRVADLEDGDAVFAAARDLVAGAPACGVVTWDESLVTPAAEVAALLNVPSMPVDAARRCRDKARQRERFQAKGVPSARFRLASSEAEAVTAAGSLGWPVVLKPRGRASSIAVRVVHTEAELREAFGRVVAAEAASISDGLVLIEEFLAGPEIAVDAWALDGRVEPFSVAAKRTGYPPYFEEVGHVVGQVLDQETVARTREVVIAANRALGTDRAITHTELMLTADGPKVVEVNGRLGGDLIPRLAELATPGLSVGAVMGAVAAGRVPAPIAEPDRLFGIRFLYPDADLRFDGVVVPPALADKPWVHEVVEVSEPGTELLLPPRSFTGRAGYGIASGRDVEEVDARLRTLAEDVSVQGAPLVSPSPLSPASS